MATGCRLGGLRLGKIAGGDHVLQDLGCALFRQRRIGARIVATGRLQETGDHGRLIDHDPCRRHAEISPGCGVHAVGAGAQVNPVEVDCEDLVLGELVLQPKRQ